VFLFGGAVWRNIGVSLWLLFYAGRLSLYPSIAHGG
jgi:hypothetical protein